MTPIFSQSRPLNSPVSKPPAREHFWTSTCSGAPLLPLRPTHSFLVVTVLFSISGFVAQPIHVTVGLIVLLRPSNMCKRASPSTCDWDTIRQQGLCKCDQVKRRRLFSFCHLEWNGSNAHFCKQSWCMENKNWRRKLRSALAIIA